MADARPLVLCADDFGLSAGIDAAILALIEAGRLSATSCMVAGDSFVTDAAALVALQSRADIGLHLTLTDLSPLGAMPRLAHQGRLPAIGAVLARAFTGRLAYEEIRAEVGRQIERFKAVIGRDPDYLDGHQHVHLLPVVRRAVFDCFTTGALQPGRTWLRNCAEPAPAILSRGVEVPKSLFIALLSAGFERRARRLGIACNDSFRGVSGFDAGAPYRADFRRYLQGDGARPLCMCHPGLPGTPAHATDIIAAARAGEYAYFSSEAFVDDLAAAGRRIARLRAA